MINEIYTGNRFRRAINQHLPFGWGSYYEWAHKKYQIPDVLDHRLPQPGGIVLHFQGPRNDMEIFCNTPKGNIPLKALSPEGTRFSIYNATWFKHSFCAHKNRLIEVPSDFLRWSRKSVTGMLLHEIGHLFTYEDADWMLTASNTLDLLDNNSLPEGCEWRKQELEAEKVSGGYEQRADATALYIESKLRRVGFDLLPDLNISGLKSFINENPLLRSEDSHHSDSHKPGFDFRLSRHDVSSIMSGELPWPRLKEIVDAHFATILPGITEMVETNKASRKPRRRFNLKGILAALRKS
ncbi:hypothetical protein A3J19_04440 [Candidatus Daviesbacteria bacterium RIFCSPLOWO2_02_FULL_41_8]|uniref:Uncharacterized protein n=2 Tax=Candidatus Daviesiibacteriota TaxID=1752718 RepID=A0A1F5NJ70_9BACT|nr:MAG: hypothetical protein A3D83_00915 [Candidatus Daviesbacteria bacterium RIFCSPHIGHO2_02_FULL_41_10]OGE77603.1 MAG: hypothetical protein A3J19_04440 [Candidatus Daviesbacteria bacterium RIFCSPLOWO2_02_FULL_41_8]